MDKGLRANIIALIKSKRGFEFEAFVSEMCLIRYSSDGYQPTRERKDNGAEGIILSSRTVIAAYGPDTYNEKKFIRKINDDFDDYINKWATAYPNWRMFYNNSLAPEQIRITDSLKTIANGKLINVDSIQVKGIEQIIQFIEEEFTNKQLRQLATFLGVPKELIQIDYIRSIIDDLIRGVGIEKENVKYNLEVDIEEKIKLNYTDEDYEAALEEYQELATTGSLKNLGNVIGFYNDEEINTLKLRIKREFNNQSGNFRTKLNNLTSSYLNKYANEQDDDFEYHTRALLIYCFEQCMIGKKTIQEK